MNSKIPSDTDQVWATISYTIPIRNYESCKIELGTSRTVTEKTEEQTRNELCEVLMNEAIELGEDMKKKIKRLHRRDNDD